MQIKDFSKIYFAILLLHLVTIFNGDSGILHVLSKPLLLFSLIAFFWQHPFRPQLRGNTTVVLALFCSLLGDIFLLNANKSWAFLAGMAAFAFTHFFMLFFHWNISMGKVKASVTFPLLVGILLFLGLMYFLTLPLNMELPVNIYAALIIMHFASAYNSAKLQQVNWWPFVGISLFLISDLLLAFNHFGHSSRYLALAVMTLYGCGQFFIVKGLLESPEDQP